MNEKIKITTDTARICVYDLFSLKHRLKDNSDWVIYEGLAEMNRGKLALLHVGANWYYEIHITNQCKTRTDLSKIIKISCPTGNVFIGACEKITGGGIEPTPKIAGEKWSFISIEPGNYNLTFTSYKHNKIELLIEKDFAEPVNHFDEEPQLFYKLEKCIDFLMNEGFIYKDNYTLTDESKKALFSELAKYDLELEMNPENEFITYYRGIVKVKLEDNKGALADFNKALEMSDWHKYEILIRRGMLKHKMGVLTEAMIDLDKAVEEVPYPVDALVARASLRYQIGDIIGAKDDVEDASNFKWP